jgi:homoserine kinase
VSEPRAVRVSVPATTSNLGPGFDCLGLALGLRNELTLELREGRGEATVEIEGEGANSLPRGPENLIVRAAQSVIAGRLEGRLAFKCKNRIPLARGLGSSAAAAVAGITAANALFARPALSQDELFEYATVLEGHPDNAAAALYGGLTVSVKRGKNFMSYSLKTHADLAVVILIPAFELKTSDSRAVVPPTALRADAVDNIARTGLLVSALADGLWDRLSVATEDRLHQPYRARFVPGFDELLKAARLAAPCGPALSGAGPAIVAFCRKGAAAEAVKAAMSKTLARYGVEHKVLVLSAETAGAKLL